MQRFNSILIVCAHPDDEVLGCGGFLSKVAKDDSVSIRIVFLAEGSSARYEKTDLDFMSKNLKKDILIREKSCIAALESIGIDKENIFFSKNPACRLDSIDTLDLGKIVEMHVQDTKPDTVITHSSTDINIDHRIVLQAVLQATRPARYNFIKRVMMCEVPSSTEWRFIKTFEPNLFVTLTREDIESKINLFSKYESELKSYPFPRSDEGIETWAKYRGMQIGQEYAEAFMLVREVI
jgi:LmbE family N-acetylglucosaminyl deacetylase